MRVVTGLCVQDREKERKREDINTEGWKEKGAKRTIPPEILTKHPLSLSRYVYPARLYG